MEGDKKRRFKVRDRGRMAKSESASANSLHKYIYFFSVTNIWFAAPYQRHKAPKKFQNPDLPLPGEKGTNERTSRFQDDCECISSIAVCTRRFCSIEQ